MIRFLKLAWLKAKRISAEKWRLLFLLATGVFLKSVAVIFWDIGSTALLIAEERLFCLGMDFICAGVLSAFIGCYLWHVDRRQGRGSIGLTTGCIGSMTMGLILWQYLGEQWAVDFLFIMKYPLYLVLTTGYWAVVHRFVKIQFTSLKFLSLFCAELFSLGIAGLIAVLCPVSPLSLLIASLFLTIGLVLVFFTIFDAIPLPRESFIRRMDGTRDVFEKPLVWDILTLVFLGMASQILAEAILYFKLASTGIQPMVVLGLVWTLFGVIGLIMVLVLYQTRYIYTTLSGMLIFGLSVIATGVMALGKHSGPVASGYLMMLLLAHFYLTGYLQILPRVLSTGIGTRLKKRMMTVASPLSFILCGSLCLNLDKNLLAYSLIGIGGLLVLLTIRSTSLYAQVIGRMIRMQRTPHGTIMLPFPRLIRPLIRLLKSPRADEVIYAINLFKNANHPAYERALSTVLNHPVGSVRVWALIQMRQLYYFGNYQEAYRRRMKRDPDPAVRSAALTNLILTDSQPRRYEKYLRDPELKAGAVGGFLARGSVAVSDAIRILTQMAQSKNVRDNMMALELMATYPDLTFGPLVENLLKHPKTCVVQQAIFAAGALRDPQLLPRLFRALEDVQLQEAAIQAIQRYGSLALPPIERMIMRPETPLIQRKQLILILGVSADSEGKQILWRALSVEDQKLRKSIVQNLLDSALIWTQADRKVILTKCLERDIQRISWLMHLRELFTNAPSHESEEAIGFFLRAIQEDIDDTRDLILYQLLLLENNAMFVKAIRVLLTDEYEMYLPAMGVIQDMMSNRLYQKIKPVLILPLSQKKRATLSSLTPEAVVQTLSDVIIHPVVSVNHWIRATALYALRRLGSPLGIQAAEAALQDPHPIVLEAAIWTLVRLQADKDLLHQRLLTIPTSRLSKLSLEQLLDS